MKKGDIFFIGSLILIVLFIYLFTMFGTNRQPNAAQVKVDGKIVYEVFLKDVKETYVLKIPSKGSDIVIVNDKGSDLTVLEVEVAKDGVRVTNAKCPDQVCVRTGTITKAGESIICVPNRVEVALIGAKNTEVDGVVY